MEEVYRGAGAAKGSIFHSHRVATECELPSGAALPAQAWALHPEFSVPPHSQVSSSDPSVDVEGSQPLPTCMRNELSAIYKNPLGVGAAMTGWFLHHLWES